MKKVFAMMMLLGLSLFAMAETAITIGGYVSNLSNGEWMYALTSDDGTWYVVYYIQSETLENGKTYTAEQLKDSYANYLSNPNNPSAQPVEHKFTDATFAITADREAKTCVIEGTFVSKKNGESYRLSYSGKLNDEPDGPNIPDPTPTDAVMDDDCSTESFLAQLPAMLAIPYMQPMLSDKEIEIRCYNITSTVEVGVVFNFPIDDFDNQTYVAEGEYVINSSRELGTVYAGQGHTTDNTSCVGTYAATVSGEQVTARWYVTEGKVEVKKSGESLYLHLSGKNSKGMDVEFEIGEKPQTPEALMNTTTEGKRSKTMQGGQLMINYNNKLYNVLGQ